jgi:hypothetical protein
MTKLHGRKRKAFEEELLKKIKAGEAGEPVQWIYHVPWKTANGDIEAVRVAVDAKEKVELLAPKKKTK